MTETFPARAQAAIECSNVMQAQLDQHSVLIHMHPDATEAEIAAVSDQLDADPGVVELVFRSAEQSLEELQDIYVDEPGLIEDVTADQLWSSFALTVQTPSEATNSELIARYEGLPGVESVYSVSEYSDCEKDDPALLETARRAIEDRFGENDLIAWIEPTQAQEHDDVRTSIEGMSEVQGIVYFSQDAALEEFRCLFSDSPELINSVSADILPPSYRIDVGEDEAVITAVEEQINDLAGVRDVSRVPSPAELLAGWWVDESPPTRVGCAIEGERLR